MKKIRFPKTLLICIAAMSVANCGQKKKDTAQKEAEPEMAKTEEDSKTWAEKLGWPAGKKVIMLHADDIGMCPEANTAAKQQLEAGDIQSAAVMIPCPNAKEFITYAKNHPKMDIGLHLTLTSEWKTHRWGPVTDDAEAVSYTHLRAHETVLDLVCRLLLEKK